jgi:hypothetical protein
MNQNEPSFGAILAMALMTLTTLYVATVVLFALGG